MLLEEYLYQHVAFNQRCQISHIFGDLFLYYETTEWFKLLFYLNKNTTTKLINIYLLLLFNFFLTYIFKSSFQLLKVNDYILILNNGLI